mmetsp:Transcript_11115/g.24893  ORF Transcript_11115/g.24893 Transcript_11115/m.24893 type:complete len:88 (+) Transcript_11115:184-447(+)
MFDERNFHRGPCWHRLHSHHLAKRLLRKRKTTDTPIKIYILQIAGITQPMAHNVRVRPLQKLQYRLLVLASAVASKSLVPVAFSAAR